MKRELKMRVLGARWMVLLAGTALMLGVAALTAAYPAAVLAGLAVYLIGRGMLIYSEWQLRRWKALHSLAKKKL